jgi:hypothetical protein
MRKEFLIGGLVAAVNIAVFGLVTPHFLDVVHHHWIVPVFCTWLFFQSLISSRLKSVWSNPIFFVVFSLAILTGILLFWRQFSMFACFRHCEGRLAMGLFMISLSFFIPCNYLALRGHRFVRAGGILFAIWAVIISIIGWAQGTLNFS